MGHLDPRIRHSRSKSNKSCLRLELMSEHRALRHNGTHIRCVAPRKRMGFLKYSLDGASFRIHFHSRDAE